MTRSRETRPDHPVFTRLYERASAAMEAGPIGSARRDLVARATGVVVDVGAGIGLNLPHLGDTVTRVEIIEPDPNMVRRLRPRLPDHAVLHEARAERLPLDDDSADTVLVTLVLCTVDDVPAVTSEIRRVLRPGGQVLVLEHVRSLDPRRARWQDRLHRPWRVFAGGCSPNRDTVAALEDAGFDTTGLTRFTTPEVAVTREWVVGRLS